MSNLLSGTKMSNFRHSFSIIGPGCWPSSSEKRASNTTVQRWFLRLAPFVLAGVTFGTLGVPARAQRSSSGPQGAPAPEPGNILPPNHDAAFDATTAQRTALLNNIPPVTDDMLQHPPDGDWLTWRRAYDSLGYSPLRQIDSNNVRNLREAWAWALPVSRNEIAPLVHDGIIFIKSANTIQALDGGTGDLLWQYVRP